MRLFLPLIKWVILFVSFFIYSKRNNKQSCLPTEQIVEDTANASVFSEYIIVEKQVPLGAIFLFKIFIVYP